MTARRRGTAQATARGAPPEGAAAGPAQWPAYTVAPRAVASLVPYARNARAHSDGQVAQLAALIREFGWTMPVLVDEEGSIIAGHGRVLAAERLGITEVPAATATGWSDAQKRAYRIADNRLSELSSWDDGLLKIELGALAAAGADLALTGFDPGDLDRLLNGAAGGEGDGIGGVPESHYSEQYGVIIMCGSEAHQAEVYERLKADGYACKVVTT